MPRQRPDVSSRASSATLRGLGAYDAGEQPAPAAEPADPVRPLRFEDRYARRTVYLENELLQALDDRRRQTGEKLATMLNDAVRAYLTK